MLKAIFGAITKIGLGFQAIYMCLWVDQKDNNLMIKFKAVYNYKSYKGHQISL